jgi:hypothetical protein
MKVNKLIGLLSKLSGNLEVYVRDSAVNLYPVDDDLDERYGAVILDIDASEDDSDDKFCVVYSKKGALDEVRQMAADELDQVTDELGLDSPKEVLPYLEKHERHLKKVAENYFGMKA